MTTVLRQPGLLPSKFGPVAINGAAAVVALGIGAEAAGNAHLALEATLALCFAIILVRSPRVILVILLASVFLEIITVGGLTINRVVAPFALIIAIGAIAGGRAVAPTGGPVKWAVAYAIWAIASALWSISFGGTVYLLASLLIAVAYALAFATLIRNLEELQRAFFALAVIALPISLYAMATFFAGSASRASGGKGDPNSFAAYELIALPLVIAAATMAHDRRRRVFLWVTSVAIIGAAITSLSRGGLITLFVLVLAVVIAPASSIFRSRRQKVVVIVTMVVGGMIAFSATGAAFSQRLDSTFTSSGSSGSGRLNMWKGAVTSIRERPFLGIGYGTFASVSTSLLERTPGVDLVNFTPSPEGDLVHDTYLETLAELGIPGLFLFLGLVVATARSLRESALAARRAGAAQLERATNALLLAVLAWAVAAVFLSLETSRPLWILIGFALAVSRIDRTSPSTT
ncbi:MAG: O-antigen ligase family protein [Gaiellaceae bacterium]